MKINEAHYQIVEMTDSFGPYEAGKIYSLEPKDAHFLMRIGAGKALFLQDLAALLRSENRDCECGNQITVHWVPQEVTCSFADAVAPALAKDFLRDQIVSARPSVWLIDLDEDPETGCSACGRPIKSMEAR